MTKVRFELTPFRTTGKGIKDKPWRGALDQLGHFAIGFCVVIWCKLWLLRVCGTV